MMLGYPGSLHCHSEYSNLRLRDSINRTSEMMEYAVELGHEVIGITEHESLSNHVKVEKQYKKFKEKHPNFKVILGNEIYLCRDDLQADNFERGVDQYFHFILLAKNLKGHEQLRQLSTRAWMRSYMTGKMRRVPTYYSDLLDIIGSDKGNVIGSTACLGGFLAQKLLQWRSIGYDIGFRGSIENWVRQMTDLFGEGNFFLEMQPSNDEEQRFVNQEILRLSEKLGVPYIITTDAHYLKKEDAPIHKAFLNAQEGEREVDGFYATTYLMCTEEIESYMGLNREQYEIAYQNILNIKDMCEDYSLLKPLKIPSLKWRTPFTEVIPEKYFEFIPWLKTFYES